MVMSGAEMLLKSVGIDPKKIMEDFTTLKDGVLKTLEKIEGELKLVRERQDQIWERMNNEQPNQPAQPLALQLRPQQPPTMQPEKPA